MWIANDWKEYEVIDTSCGEKLERWGKYTLVRPDPQVIWDTPKVSRGWKNMNAHYHRSKKGGGEWEFFDLPQQWDLHYKDLTFHLKPFSFKHTGLFPEQAVNWDWFGDKIRNAGRPVKVLNLFAYTGGATLAAAAAGAHVTHVDASKGMVNWAKENAAASGLSEAPIRWLVDDCVKFVEREIRRGNHYDAIIMDPPSYGRGPKGEIWKIEEAIHPLIKLCVKLLSPNPLFFLINSYTTGLAPAVLTYMLSTELKDFDGHVDSQEIGLPVTSNGLVLPCGASGRWEAKENILILLKINNFSHYFLESVDIQRYNTVIKNVSGEVKIMTEERPNDTLPYTCTPAYDRSNCGNCVCATCYEQEFCNRCSSCENLSRKKESCNSYEGAYCY